MSKVAVINPSLVTEAEEQETLLPPKKDILYRMARHPLFRPYYRLAALMMGLNIFAISQFMPALLIEQVNFALLMITINFFVGTFIRQQWVINVLFKIATSVPKSWPIEIRWAAGKVYHFGGIHIGAFASATAWTLFATSSVLLNGASATDLPIAAVFILPITSLILLGMITVAMPQIRHPHHNLFENVGRFGLWTVTAMFYFLVPMIADHRNAHLFEQAEFYGLLGIIVMIALPWLRLQKIPVNVETPSNHAAIATFDYGVTPFAGSSTDLSWNPLFEWHSFANIPAPDRTGFRLTISRAGDWTGEFIDKKPKHIWVKGIPAAGVGNVELCFKKVIWVATGSGIGPCIPHLLDKKVPGKLVWSTRDPAKTYGDELVEEIMQAQPDATIWNTTTQGKPDLVKLAYEAYKVFDAEAVIVISNQKTTFHVNYELESRGIPAFGAIWDS